MNLEFTYSFDEVSEETAKPLDARFFKLINSDLTRKNYCIGYALGATELICKIFYRYKDYYVIFIGEPHPNPNRAVPQFGMRYSKIKQTADLTNFILPKEVKNVLVYFTSTCYQTGETHNTNDVVSFMDGLRKKNINVVSVNDAVQQLFFVKAKYTAFDYIIYTAHSIIGGFDMGVCIQRRNDTPLLGNRWYTDAKKHIEALEKLLPLKGIETFRDKMFEFFNKEIKEGKLIPVPNSAKHFFVAEIKQNPLAIEKFFDSHFMERYDNKYFIKVRFQDLNISDFDRIQFVKNIFVYDFIDS